MRLVLFVHSLFSDWNHGNAHFLRGVARELQRNGHEVTVYEPRDGWSRANLVQEHGQRGDGQPDEHVAQRDARVVAEQADDDHERDVEVHGEAE